MGLAAQVVRASQRAARAWGYAADYRPSPTSYNGSRGVSVVAPFEDCYLIATFVAS